MSPAKPALTKAVDPEKLTRLIGRSQSQGTRDPVQTGAITTDRPLQTTAGAVEPWH